MQNNIQIIEKARKYLKRYKLWSVILSLSTIVFCILLALTRNIFAIIGGGLLLIFALFLGAMVLFRKCVLDVLNDKLEADEYLATIYLGKFDTPAATWQLLGEYYCGHYANVVGICKQKLAEPKVSKRNTYIYLTYLANVYFEMGDDQNLRSVLEKYQACLITEKPKVQAKYKKQFLRMAFYEAYLNGDREKCEAWLNQSTPVKLNAYHRTYIKARLALWDGDWDEARGCFESLACEVPQLCYGKLAMHWLQNDDRQATYAECFSPVADVQVNLFPSPHRKIRKVLIWVIIGVAMLRVGLGILEGGLADRQNEQYLEKVANHRENIRVMVEEDYDSVAVVDSFNLKKGDEMVDSMFVCVTDKEVLIGTLFVYEGEEQLYYDVVADISLGTLTHDASPLKYCAYYATTSSYYIHSYFYKNEADIPEVYEHMSSFAVNGETYYYVITEINELEEAVPV